LQQQLGQQLQFREQLQQRRQLRELTGRMVINDD